MSEPSPTTADGSDRPGRRRRRWPWIVAAVVVLWIGVAAWQLMEAQVSAEDGLDAMEEVRGAATGDLSRFVEAIGDDDAASEQEVVEPLRRAAAEFTDARDRVGSPVLAPLRVLPWIGRQLRSVSAMSAAAATTAGAAADAYESLEEESRAPVDTPEQRLASVRRTDEVLRSLSGEVTGLDLGPDEGLVGPLARARDRVTEEYGQVEQTLSSAATAADGVTSFLSGPSRYLVLASNNAEMRAGSGMFLQAGPMDVVDGRFELGDLEPTDGMLLAPPGATLDPDVAALWGWALPGREFRNVNLTPRFDESARTTADMWELSGRGPVDGVIAVDVVGVRELLSVTGPVTVADPAGGPPLEVSEDNVEQLLLVDQYEALGEETEQRRELLGEVASAVFTAFNERRLSASGLLRVLQDAGGGRHLLMWSSEDAQQDGWEALGTSGRVTEDSMLLAVQNRNGTKLDRYLDVRSTVSATPAADGLRRVTVAVEVANTAPADLPTYVEGPYEGLSYGAGEYGGLLALSVPEAAGNFAATGADGSDALTFSGDDGPTRTMVSQMDLPRGASTRVTFSFDVPEGLDQVEILPSARVPAVTWVVDGEEWRDTRPRTVPLPR